MKDLLDEKLTGATDIRDSQRRFDEAIMLSTTAEARRAALVATERRRLAEQILKDKEAEIAANKKTEELSKPADKKPDAKPAQAPAGTGAPAGA